MENLSLNDRSSVMILRNMVGPEDLDEYLKDEIKEECSKFGNVVEVVIDNDEEAKIVKIFVRFTEAAEVDEAIKALNGRYFAGHLVKAEVYDQDLFDKNDLSG